MPQRLALIAASVAATIVLTVGLVAAGFAPSSGNGQSAQVNAEGSTAASEASPAEKLEPKVVYIKPAPTPKTVVLKKQAKPQKRVATSGSGTKAARQVRYERDDDDRYEGREKSSERREHERDDD